ncbi:MAG TPA: ammonium transporter [Tepidisphaeraceae bacterium]|jgi:Amt family ammonium transporter|nr:ammonium transporter [Tepidisphaeraceae bacterium]
MLAALAILLCLTLYSTARGQATAATPPPTAQDAINQISNTNFVANTLWTLIGGMLVFWMNAGFACLETGLCRRKNAVNILAKNFIVFAISSIAFWCVGFALMFGDGNSVVGHTGFFTNLLPYDAPKMPGASSLDWSNVSPAVKFFFELVFAGTAATIVSGAVAERIKFGMFMIFSFILVALVYPITGHWIWGGGWLSTLKAPFHDFAGSTVVHSVGGWAALAGVLLLGPRIGKYNSDGSVNPIPGHNMGLAALGCLILWLGWFGFNPGSTMTATVAAGHIAVTTNTAAAFGAVAATITAWAVLGKPDLSMILNGCLAGLVAITAPCAVVTIAGSAIIGAIAGALVVFSVLFWDKIKVDDPVGALSVHLVCGIFGTLCVGLFASPAVIPMQVTDAYCKPGLFYGGGGTQLISQLMGIGAVAATVFAISLVAWAVLKFTGGIRVSAAEEHEGLDIGEHGMEAYPGFATETGASEQV